MRYLCWEQWLVRIDQTAAQLRRKEYYVYTLESKTNGFSLRYGISFRQDNTPCVCAQSPYFSSNDKSTCLDGMRYRNINRAHFAFSTDRLVSPTGANISLSHRFRLQTPERPKCASSSSRRTGETPRHVSSWQDFCCPSTEKRNSSVDKYKALVA